MHFPIVGIRQTLPDSFHKCGVFYCELLIALCLVGHLVALPVVPNETELKMWMIMNWIMPLDVTRISWICQKVLRDRALSFERVSICDGQYFIEYRKLFLLQDQDKILQASYTLQPVSVELDKLLMYLAWEVRLELFLSDD